MGLSIGIVGLPNVGKSTLFNALTRKRAVVSNYPFATIDPNVGVVPVPDPRLEKIAEIAKPQEIVHATVEFVDIAGLVKGANEGEGLGNQFLANIREVDAIAEVVRYFSDPDVAHVTGRVDPEGDIETIRIELVLADLGTVERAITRLEKELKRDKGVAPKLAVVKRVQDWLSEGHRALKMEMTDEERELLRDLHLLTMKPLLYVANIDEGDIGRRLDEVDGVEPVPICAKIEAEISELAPEELSEYLEMEGLKEPGLDVLIHAAYELLGLQSFFTAGEKQARAWTVRKGATTYEAAGEIHTDFQRGFIKAEVVNWADYVELGGEKGAREAGKLRVEGKDHVVAEGDLIHFRSNV